MKKGLVLYTDGGCRPNPGYGGSGIHGYLYTEEVPKKGAGQGLNILTAEGYVVKSEVPDMLIPPVEVTPIEYYDGFVSFSNAITNNVAELTATTEALIHAKNMNVDRVLIQTDSEYVRKGVEGWIKIWPKNNWLLRDSTPVKNADVWKRLVATKNELEERGVIVEVKWVRGHDGLLGNEMADRLATIGVMKSRLSLIHI